MLQTFVMILIVSMLDFKIFNFSIVLRETVISFSHNRKDHRIVIPDNDVLMILPLIKSDKAAWPNIINGGVQKL